MAAKDLFQKKLEKLMKNIDKPVEIPKRREKRPNEGPDFVRNVMGSSAGAGSGEFHVYRHLRRKEYARQKQLEIEAKVESLDSRYQQKLLKNRQEAEERTAKKRQKRLKKKQKLKKINKSNETRENLTSDDEDEADEEDDENGKYEGENESKEDSHDPAVDSTDAKDKGDANSTIVSTDGNQDDADCGDDRANSKSIETDYRNSLPDDTAQTNAMKIQQVQSVGEPV